MVKKFSYCSDQLSKWGKKSDQSYFDRGRIVGAKQSGLSISETAHLLQFLHTNSLLRIIYFIVSSGWLRQ